MARYFVKPFCKLKTNGKLKTICHFNFPKPIWHFLSLLINAFILINAIFFCINFRVFVLINQYWTRLFVSHYSVQRKTQLHENTLLKKQISSRPLFILFNTGWRNIVRAHHPRQPGVNVIKLFYGRKLRLFVINCLSQESLFSLV